MLTSSGIVHYDTADGPWVTVWVDQQLADYCHSLIPKYHRVVRPRWKAHVTVVRPEDFFTNPDPQFWGKHEGEQVNFVYDPTVLYEKGFWWFNLWCVTMEDIRRELGLSTKSRITIPPLGYSKAFHCTVGKDLLIA
jgi:hypothetical protein